MNLQNYETNICTLENGVPNCEYKFTNLPIRDNNNNLYYYKIGVSSLYKTNNNMMSSNFILLKKVCKNWIAENKNEKD